MKACPSDRRLEPEGAATGPAVLVLNAKARSGREQSRAVEAALHEAGVELVEVISPKRPAEISGRVKAALALGARRVLVGGGDGTVSGVARLLVGTQAVLGVIPLGTGNDFARGLGIPVEPQGAAAVIASGRVARIDVGTANGTPFLNAASVGLSSRLTHQLSPQLKRRWEKLAYPLVALSTARRFQPFVVKLESAGVVTELEALQVVVGNGRFHGAGQLVAPDATFEDRRLDVYAIAAASIAKDGEPEKRVRKWKDLHILTGVAARLRFGSHVEHPWVVHQRAEGVIVRTDPPLDVDVDGELLGEDPGHLRGDARRALGPRARAAHRPLNPEM